MLEYFKGIQENLRRVLSRIKVRFKNKTKFINPSSSRPPNETNIESEFPKILPDFEYLLSETETQIFIIDKDLEDNYKILDLAIDHRVDHDNLYPFRRYI